MAGSLPIILLPGMGADERLFAAQRAALPELTVPAWLPPERDEPLASYARRMATVVDPGGPCLVGGVSFGGMVAVEMARHLEAKACLLIASVKSPDELPLRVRMFKPVAWMIPVVCAGLLPLVARAVLAIAKRRLRPSVRLFLEQATDTNGRFLKWASLAILRWRVTEPLVVPVVHMHGDRDRIIPHGSTHPDVLVSGGGHLLPISHAGAVNNFLRDQRDRFST